MYRILKGATYSVNNNNLPFNYSLFIQNYYKTVYCTSCRCEIFKAINNINRRNQSSYTNLQSMVKNVGNVTKKKKQKKSKVKYAELLEINKDSSNVTRAVVKHFTPEQMALLIENPHISLEQLHNLTPDNNKKVIPSDDRTNDHNTQTNMLPNVARLQEIATFSNDVNSKKQSSISSNAIHDLDITTKTENIKDVKNHKLNFLENLTAGESGALKNSTICSIDIEDDKKKKVKKKVIQQSKQSRKNDLEKYQKNFNLGLLSYLDVCINCGFLNRGFSALCHYINKYKNNQINCMINNVSIFNTLMHGFASKGNLEKVNFIYKMMKQYNITPSPQTYAACFECLARLPSSTETKNQLKSFYDDLLLQNYTLNDLFTKCMHTDRQRTFVLKAVRVLYPNYKMPLQSHQLNYSSPIVNELNNTNNQKQSFEPPAHNLLTTDEMKNLIQKQLSIENQFVLQIKSAEKPAQLTSDIVYFRKKWLELEDMWKMSLREGLARELKQLRQHQHNTNSFAKISIYPYMRALTAEQYVNIMMSEVRKLARGSEVYSSVIRQLYCELGEQVKQRYHLKFKQNYGILQKTEKLYMEYCNWYLNPESDKLHLNSRQLWQTLLDKYQNTGPSMDIKEKDWPTAILVGIGKFLYNIIIKDVKIDVNAMKKNSTAPQFMPAFYILFRFHSKKVREEIKPHPTFNKLFRSAALETIEFSTNLLPMLSPPLPWVTINTGGYLINKTRFSRLVNNPLSLYNYEKLSKVPAQQLYPIFDSLNQLSSIPWTVNEKILDVMLKVFQDGGSEKLNIPLSTASFMNLKGANCNNESQQYKERMAFNIKKGEMYSLWCEALYKLSLANHFRRKLFWLPHNIDFRGRVYPVPPHLQHLGSDMARSLLYFAKGKPLGPNGLNWLKVHCINLTGLKKKSSTKERLEYANEILSDILDSAERPLTGKMWWAEAEDKWQTLACCMEIKSALDSNCPEHYVCHFPVHQDGSCNGLQHYAALGRDEAGAIGVNLYPSDTPQDVYSCVVELVENERKRDAEMGLEIAKTLDGFIQRKVIKQTVMTTVYGVTRYGARLQIAKQLKDIDSFPQDLVQAASSYLVEKTFLSLRKMFSSARHIQDWFTECAGLISTCYERNVEWITPLGLPIVQPYSKTSKPTLINVENEIKEINPRSAEIRPDTIKQKNAFPPNFIHSLDSTHMMLTSLHMERTNATFVSVHDCFWTHPCSVEIMNEICRKQFLVLHSQPILENLSSYFYTTYCNSDKNNENSKKLGYSSTFKNVPKKGNFQLEQVLDSVYFFS